VTAVVVARRVPFALPRVAIGVPRALPSRRAVALAIAPILVVAAVAGALLATAAPAFRVRALDIGQGDAFLIEAGGKLALIDGGPDPNRLLAELGASLPAWRRRIDVVALTHAHLDHGAGLIAVLDRYEVGLAVAPRGLNAGPLADAWNGRLAARHVERADVTAGSVVRFGPARIRVLAPNDDPLVDVPSLVLRLEVGAVTVLFSGDATEAAQADLLLQPDALRARVYVPPHHGAGTPYAAALVGAVKPEVALISVGLDNRYGHPTAETLAALAGVPTYRTDRDGTVEVQADGARLVVHAHANGLSPPRPQGIPRLPR
jgi:competence protein ComEC